jgi:hypothetical protein
MVWRRGLALGLLGLSLVGVGLVLWSSAGSAGAEAPGELVAEPVLQSAAAGVETLFGVASSGVPGEVWGESILENKVVRYTPTEGWQRVPVTESAGSSPATLAPGTAAGRTTPAGGLVLATTSSPKSFVVRDPGAGVRAITPPLPELLLDQANLARYEAATPEEAERIFSATGEELFGETVRLTAVEEAGGVTGAFVAPAPQTGGVQDGILHYDGESWVREPICTTAPKETPPAETPPSEIPPGERPATEPPATEPPPAEVPPAEILPPGCVAPEGSRFRVVAIEANGPGDAWLLAKGGTTNSGVELFEREGGVWRQRELQTALGERFARAQSEPSTGVTVAVAPRENGQSLTVTPAGVWVDVALHSPATSATSVDGTFYYDIEKKEVTGSWCELAAAPGFCSHTADVELPAEGRSFAWPPASPTAGEPFGKRVVTGIGQGALLSFAGETFDRIPVGGGDAGGAFGAALAGPEEGWLGAGQGPLRLTRTPEPATLAPWPVPFRRPLLAVAPAPEGAVGNLGSEALAVGSDGQAARYVPGQGWIEEPFLNSSGARATPDLTAVAWPEPSRAYAVGDDASMWVWQKATGLWETDPAEPPNLYRANFTGIAFQPGEPNRGYAVGKQGLLLGYGRRWTQETLPPEVNAEVNFTSVAFAGSEALATYKFPEAGTPGNYSGGLLVDEGSGWRTEPELSGLPVGAAPQLVSGLPDGGAVVVTTGGQVYERESATAPWAKTAADLGKAFPVALAAFRENGQIRAIVSVESLKGKTKGALENDWSEDLPQVEEQPPSDQAPLLTEPYVPGASGFLERQTPTGWRDEEHALKPLPTPAFSGQSDFDLPALPDPVLALMVSEDGSEGWTVGGETGFDQEPNQAALQTAGVMRYGAAATPPSNEQAAPIAAEGAAVSFAVAGQDQCAGPCADLVGTGIGPDRWLKNATESAAAIGLEGATVPTRGVSAFLYTGSSVAETRAGESLSHVLSSSAFSREEQAYARRLGIGAGSLPAFAAPAPSDLDSTGSLGTFDAAFGAYSQPLGGSPPGIGITPMPREAGAGYYSFEATGAGAARHVRVIVLDYSAPTLSGEQQCWLGEQLEGAAHAGTPAIIVGNRDLDPVGESPNLAADAAIVGAIVVTGEAQCPSGKTHGPGASAYFFDYPNQNRTYQLSAEGRSIPSFGTGTLGYGLLPAPNETDYAGAAGYLLASVDVEQRNPVTNVAPVQVRLIPDVGELALDAEDGTLLRRSQVATFSALARRPQAGGRCAESNAPQPSAGGCEDSPDPYIPIPAHCIGAKCGSTVFPSYRFTSSDPEVANFVEADPASIEPDTVLLRNEETVPDETSGLLCAFNAGTTTVTIEAGGRAYSEQVTVQPGSVARPCGTVPLANQAAQQQKLPLTPLAPLPTQSPNFSQPNGTVPPPPPPPTPPTHSVPTAPVPIAQPALHPQGHPTPPPAPPSPTLPSFLQPSPGLAPIAVIVPPPPPPAVEPTPPSGTSPVTQPATSPEPEQEEEAAFDLVHHAVAINREATLAADLFGTRHSTGLPTPVLPGLVILAAIGAVGTARTRRRRDPEPAFAQRHDRGGT